MTEPEGHRERLRLRFRQNPEALSAAEHLELLLTYAIPRRDVATLAECLMSRFGGLEAILSATDQELMEIDGIGESTIIFIRLLTYLVKETQYSVIENSLKPKPSHPQLNLFELEPGQNMNAARKKARRKKTEVKKPSMRVFANDEIVNTLALLPKAAQFETLDDYKQYLNEKLPYNAEKTRLRRANYFIERYFPEGSLDVPLSYYLARYTTQVDLKPVIFYHMLKAEPIAAKVAEELIWPALPIGRVERDQIREFVLRYLPDASESSQANMLRALFYTYDLLGIGTSNDTTLRFQLRAGTLESFLYILTCEYPQPGMYSYEALYSSPIHRWMLWDREWIRKQLYNLQDFGVLTKISEIDTVRQFTLAVDQSTALRLYFEHPERERKAVRDQAEHQNIDQEG
jgi:hypothetical protein